MDPISRSSLKTVRGIDPIIVDSRSGLVTRGNAENLPFADKSFDIILNIESSHLYVSCQQFFRECSRVLSEHGFLCWADIHYTHKLNLTLNEAEQSGLRLIQLEDITEQVLQGIAVTSARYDAMLQTAPYFIRLFRNSIRATYCAPGTESYRRLMKREKIYICACWTNR
ncbi:unnamed protein product [Gongylonema pulchrum]|uniref:Methyltransf_11 domain-containing protein n=1 Tax=Gongylonema pulchrum TaxID=637853 RepID=A0A183EX63_9BILA|nr:unnamed protein product [Gongylonema pulchrum]